MEQCYLALTNFILIRQSNGGLDTHMSMACDMWTPSLEVPRSNAKQKKAKKKQI